jgi:hypothetical protein
LRDPNSHRKFSPLMARSHLLIAAGLIALIAGLAPSANRWWQGHRQQQRIDDARNKLASEATAARQALATQRDAILAELRSLQAAGQHDAVIALAARYRLADDKDVHAIYQQSANAVSLRQTLERMRALTAAQCQTATAVAAVRQLVQDNHPALRPIDTANWTAAPLPAVASLPAIQQQVRGYLSAPKSEVHSHESSPPTKPFTAGELHRDHSPRLQPAVVAQLLDDAAAAAYACVWRVSGSAGSPARGFDVVIWLAPAANEKMLDYDVLSARARQ